RVKVIPGREEARLIALGVRYAIDLRGRPTLIIDAGGGSVEAIVIEDGKPVALYSLKIGVARLSERFLTSSRPSAKEVADLEACLTEELEPVCSRSTKLGVRRVVSTSGTLLNLITIAGYARGEPPNGQLNNFAITADEVSRVRRQVIRADRDERLH